VGELIGLPSPSFNVFPPVSSDFPLQQCFTPRNNSSSRESMFHAKKQCFTPWNIVSPAFSTFQEKKTWFSFWAEARPILWS
jgi:hypothetical protein